MQTREQLAMRVSRHTIIGNSLLTAFKLIAGIFGASAAMLSDAVHSLSDVCSTVVVMIGVRLSNRAADKQHPYGHERLESVAAILLAMLLCATGVGIGSQGLRALLQADGPPVMPGLLPMVAAVVSIIAKEAMYWYTRAAARKIKSGALMADAWHHRSDALSSVGSFAGILGARMGFAQMDALACFVICLFILKAAFDIFKDAVSKMIDQSCDEETEERMRAVILAQADVLRIDTLKTRMFGDRVYVDVEISADGGISLRHSHSIAHRVADTIESSFPDVKHCMVHVNPAACPPPTRPTGSITATEINPS